MCDKSRASISTSQTWLTLVYFLKLNTLQAYNTFHNISHCSNTDPLLNIAVKRAREKPFRDDYSRCKWSSIKIKKDEGNTAKYRNNVMGMQTIVHDFVKMIKKIKSVKTAKGIHTNHQNIFISKYFINTEAQWWRHAANFVDRGQ